MNKKFIFYVLTIGLIGAAILTLTPDMTASKVCYLGYKAHCSFTPFGTIVLFALAGITFTFAKRSSMRETK